MNFVKHFHGTGQKKILYNETKKKSLIKKTAKYSNNTILEDERERAND